MSLPAVVNLVFETVQKDVEFLVSLTWPLLISVVSTFAVIRLFKRMLSIST